MKVMLSPASLFLSPPPSPILSGRDQIAVATDPTPDVTAVCVESGDITATVPAAAITSTGESTIGRQREVWPG